MLKYIVFILLAPDLKVKFTNNLTSAQDLGMFTVLRHLLCRYTCDPLITLAHISSNIILVDYAVASQLIRGLDNLLMLTPLKFLSHCYIL